MSGSFGSEAMAKLPDENTKDNGTTYFV